MITGDDIEGALVRARLVRLIRENLERMPAHQALAVAISVLIDIAKDMKMTRKLFLETVDKCWGLE